VEQFAFRWNERPREPARQDHRSTKLYHYLPTESVAASVAAQMLQTERARMRRSADFVAARLAGPAKHGVAPAVWFRPRTSDFSKSAPHRK